MLASGVTKWAAATIHGFVPVGDEGRHDECGCALRPKSLIVVDAAWS